MHRMELGMYRLLRISVFSPMCVYIYAHIGVWTSESIDIYIQIRFSFRSCKHVNSPPCGSSLHDRMHQMTKPTVFLDSDSLGFPSKAFTQRWHKEKCVSMCPCTHTSCVHPHKDKQQTALGCLAKERSSKQLQP